MTYTEIQGDLVKIKEYSNINESDVHTKKVMREETELILKKQRAIYNILTVVTIVTILITVKYVQN